MDYRKTSAAMVSGKTLREIKAVLKAISKEKADPNVYADARRRARLLYTKIELLGYEPELSFGGRLDGKKDQQIAILEYLQQGNELSKLEALKLFGCLSLNGVICNLRRAGNEIQSRTQVVGKNKNISVYWIDKK